MKAFLTSLAVALLLCSISFAGEAQTVRLLTIGNSFSRNATNHLGDLAKAGGHKLIHTSIVVGGASLELHSDKALKNAEDPKDKAGLYTNGRSLVQELKAQPWDYVTLQQASIKSHDLSTYQPYAGRLAALIHEHAPTAQLLVHQTWAYRKDDPRFTKPSDKPGEPKTQEEMYQMLTAAYQAITEELKAQRIPVGDAFHLADTDAEWGYQTDTAFDLKKAKAPELPSQKHSLHVGWTWKTDAKTKVKKLGMDGHHANTAGEYLGACVWYEVLFGESSVGNSYIPAKMEPEYARFLQKTAHRAVETAKEDLGNPESADSTAILKMPNLVAFWDFQEAAGEKRWSQGGEKLALQEKKGPINRVQDGVFGPWSVDIKRGQWLMLPRAEIGALNIHGKEAQVTVVAWVKRQAKEPWQAIAGVWDETHKHRQYCLFLNAPRGTRADEMKRYPLANRIHGHVSGVGGPTPGEEFCITYSSGATEIPLQQWHCLAMSYDGQASRVFVDGKLDSLEHYNPFPYSEGLHDGGVEGADFTVGAVHRGGVWGNFFGGQIGGLAVFNRALEESELQTLVGLTAPAE
ncbi:Concanavalin A-like lectin/glucanases superfamily protein [Prosthecobacter debontii]|uniref:Concanavalin A-like lectin/glucanases superfamily protein n=1 Tax=Prosthecobacter debontii TaxID=48467 RepID=A0A1T4YU48_9BACT|nr:DUF4886 domain-containing protein [Prosthecobacter debontii]SKB05246.1 Concanavalin A-like lectin/glucanases superfamily protein [Prosthecobacter debontii]